MRPLLYKTSDWIASVAKIGYLPVAPGTWGSFIALLVWWYFIPEQETVTYILILVNLFLIGVITSSITSEQKNEKDPSSVVIDEWVGMWLTLVVVPKQLIWMMAAFFIFRLFDIAKIFPIKHLEKLNGGWGIMLDDVLAAIYALIVLLLLQAVL